MQKARIPNAINVGESEVVVDVEGLILKEQEVTSPLAMLMGATTEAVIAFPNDAVSDEERAVLTSEPIMQDITKFFDIEEVKALLPEGHFMTFAMSYEYELID